MATKQTIKNMIAAIKHIYPYYAKDVDISYTISLWEMTMVDYDDSIVNTAFLKALKTCKQPPTPADVIENINAIYNANLATAEELWSIAKRAMPKVNAYFHDLQYPVYGDTVHPRKKLEKLWNSLPYEIKNYFGNVDMLKTVAQYSDKDMQYEKSRFIKNLPQIRLTEENKKLLSSGQINIKHLTE